MFKRNKKINELSAESLATIEKIMSCQEDSRSLSELVVALGAAKLTQYRSTEGMTKRFGIRLKMADTVGFVFTIINGMANEIDRLNQLNEQINGK